jgi:type III pantothenate kinase
MANELQLLAVSVGNTRTRLGLFRGARLEESLAMANDDVGAIVAGAAGMLEKAAHETAIVIASVNDPVADRLAVALDEAAGGEVYRFGRDLVLPVQSALSDDAAGGVGQDRLLNALGAYSRAKQACIVIDAGTAITVDFVDGEGVFQGGAIAPGVNLMLRGLHEHTAALPEVRFEGRANGAGAERASPADGDGDEVAAAAKGEPWGKDTRGAMLVGVRGAARGLAHELIGRYAEFYGAYPQIVATGGDARALFEGDEVIEHIVPDLTLLGIQAACAAQLGGEDDEGAE